LIGNAFISARGIRSRLNVNCADLALLNAVPLYESRWTEVSLARVIAHNAQKMGWLIFFTHDIVTDPDMFGCTPSLLEFAVREARNAGCEVMTVKDVVAPDMGADEVIKASALAGKAGE